MVAHNCLTELHSFYSIKQFTGDYFQADYHAATLVIDIVEGKRRFAIPAGSSAVSQALKRDSSIALQTLQFPPDLRRMPEKWKWMIELHAELCRYFLPGSPDSRFLGAPIAAVDVFCTLSASTTGGHHDTGDVFFILLEGEKVWTVECQPDPNMADNPYKQRMLSGMDLEPANETITVALSPGDCLYMPPYTYHRVRADGPRWTFRSGFRPSTPFNFSPTIVGVGPDRVREAAAFGSRKRIRPLCICESRAASSASGLLQALLNQLEN